MSRNAGRPKLGGRRQALATALVLFLALTVIACSVAATGDLVALRTQPPQTGETPGPCMAALIEGQLIESDSSGVGLKDSYGLVRDVIWPWGYSAKRAGGLLLIDDHGATVARVGDIVRLAGGEAEGQAWTVCPGTVEVRAPWPTESAS